MDLWAIANFEFKKAKLGLLGQKKVLWLKKEY